MLGFGIFHYVLLDGFDLGVGLLFGFAQDSLSRRLIINSIAPIWDGNETWLVLSSMGLLAAFPLVFAILIPALYFPILLMLLGLVFRGAAFELREREDEKQRFWDHAFFAGSALAAFSQGVVIGAFIQGFQVDGRQFSGSSFDCFTIFTIMTGVALLFGYGLLGAGWLILKTENELQVWARRQANKCLLGVILAFTVVSIWTPLQDADVARRWFSWPNMLYLAPVPACTGLLAIAELRAIRNASSRAAAVLLAIGLFIVAYMGVGISFWPMVIPHHYTLWQAAAGPSTQVFLLVGLAFLLPIILMYTAWSYWVFRGKVRADIGY
ncbi:MAG: cytochrome d ubiquinol oxidase subunit II [Steroidobacteraceae bacterium]